MLLKLKKQYKGLSNMKSLLNYISNTLFKTFFYQHHNKRLISYELIVLDKILIVKLSYI